MFNGLVSIIIPAYNASNYLNEAIDSALSQTYDNIEIVVVNDGSTDNGATEKIALSYGDRIRYFSKENGGCASALNYGMTVMKGEYFSWLSHDDLYKPERTKSLLELLDKFSIQDYKKYVLGSNDLILNPEGRLSKNIFNNSVGMISPEQAFHETLNVKTINGCSLLIPKAILDEVGGFLTDYKHLLDRELWMRIALAGYSYCFAEEPMAISRVHNAQITVKAQSSLYQEEEKLICDYTLKTNSIDKADFLRPLCFFAYKRKHYVIGLDVKHKLNALNALDVKTKMQILKYSVNGKLRRLIGPMYKKMLRK